VESQLFNEWVAVPFHRLNMISPPTSAGGFGIYRDRLRNAATLPISESINPNPTSGFQLFPVPVDTPTTKAGGILGSTRTAHNA